MANGNFSQLRFMRSKVVIPVLLLGGLFLVSIWLAKAWHREPLPPAPAVSLAKVAQPAGALAENPSTPAPALPSPPPPPALPAVAPPPAAPSNAVPAPAINPPPPDAAAVQAEINRLEDLQSNDDAASLHEILKDLTNASPAIRHAAIEATMQFGGHDAVPVLKDLASRTDDPEEKSELQEAAEFLSLPTISEVLAQKRLERAQGGAAQP
jgi:hypothetical protein